MEDKKLSAEELERADFDAYCESKGYGSFTTRELLWPCWQARAALARHPQPECGDIAWIFEAVSAKVECNCPWNPDSHDKGCAVYLRDRLSDAQRLLAERDARIEALTEYAAAVEKSADKAEQERDQLRARVAELEGLLVRVVRNVPQVCGYPGLLSAIDAALNPPQANSQEQTP